MKRTTNIKINQYAVTEHLLQLTILNTCEEETSAKLYLIDGLSKFFA